MHVNISRCPNDRLEDALRIVYHQHEPRTRAALVADAIDGRTDIEFDGLWVAESDQSLVGVMLTQTLRGKTLGIWPPEVVTSRFRGGIASMLVAGAIQDADRRGFEIAQCLLAPDAPAEAGHDLERGGLPFVTDLLFFRSAPGTPVDESRPVPTVTWDAFQSASLPTFLSVLAATYEGSLDLPELIGGRVLEDLLTGTENRNPNTTRLWQRGRTSGSESYEVILIMSESAERSVLEINYLGIVPHARRQGLGRAAIQHARALAGQSRRAVELAVDVRNRPAMQLYARNGFASFERRALHLKRLGQGQCV